MNRNKKTIFLGFIVSLTLILTQFATIHSHAYDWNLYTSHILSETDNVAYGAILDKTLPENQYLQIDYASNVRYVKEGLGSSSTSYGNDSTAFRTIFPSYSSSYYMHHRAYDYLTGEWENHPTYMQAYNLTGTGPNLNFTSGVKTLGVLSLNSKTALVLEANILYVFQVNLKAGDIYDLNAKSTSTVNFYVYYNEMLSSYDNVNGYTRNFQPLIARGAGEHLLYLYSSVENDVIISPRVIETVRMGANDAISRNFVNEPDQIWNETRQVYQENRDKETVHAYYLSIAAGTYEFKYSVFDSITSGAWIVGPNTHTEEANPATFFDMLLGGFGLDKFTIYFETDFNAVIFVTAEYDNTDYIEFEYILSVKEVQLPIYESGKEYHIQDDSIAFGFEVEQTQVVYMNKSTSGQLDFYFLKYSESGDVYSFTYSMYQTAEETDKIILEPGFYYVWRPTISSYDFMMDIYTLDYVDYESPSTFNIQQENGDPTNYMLIKFNYTGFEYVNYNLTMMTQANYTIEGGYLLFNSPYEHYYSSGTFVLGRQFFNGSFEEYGIADSQELVVFSQEDNNVRYVMFYVTDIYNNTDYIWSDYGDAFVNQTTVQLRMKNDSGYPDVFTNVNIREIDAALNALGYGTIDSSFVDVVNPRDLYIIRAQVPELSWYKIKIIIVNGTRSGSYYTFPNILDPFFHNYFYREKVLNRYYFKDTNTNNYFVFYDSSNISHVIYEIEFGIYDPDLVFMFNVYHSGYNGTIHFEFIPHNCTSIMGSDLYGDFGGIGLSKGAIIGLAVAGSIIVIGTVTIVIFRVVLPRRRP